MLLAAALVLACTAVDGDTLQCAGIGRVRLHAIDAAEMPGHCRPGRVCVQGDPFAAKAALAAMVDGRAVSCTDRGRDRYGRMLAQCQADGIDLSCALVATGHAVERYARLTCD